MAFAFHTSMHHNYCAKPWMIVDLDEFVSSNGDFEISGIEFEIPNQPMPEDSSFHQPNVKDALEELGVDDVGLVLEQAEVVQAEIISQAQSYRESIVVTRQVSFMQPKVVSLCKQF